MLYFQNKKQFSNFANNLDKFVYQAINEHTQGKKVNKIESKEQLRKELKKAGIKICLSRSIGCNKFNLIHESYGTFYVNATFDTSWKQTFPFMNNWVNVNISVQ